MSLLRAELLVLLLLAAGIVGNWVKPPPKLEPKAVKILAAIVLSIVVITAIPEVAKLSLFSDEGDNKRVSPEPGTSTTKEPDDDPTSPAPEEPTEAPPPPPTPKISWHFLKPKADVGTKVSAVYRVTDFPSGGRLVLQRSEGSAGTYQDVMTLNASDSSLRTAVAQPGRLTYRLAVTLGGETLAQSTATLTAYQNVPLTRILGSSIETIEVGNTLFAFAAFNQSSYAGFSPMFKTSQNVCDRLDLKVGYTNEDPSYVGQLRVVQQHLDARTFDIPAGVVKAVSVRLSGGFQIDTKTKDDNGLYNGEGVFVNGTMHCLNASGPAKE